MNAKEFSVVLGSLKIRDIVSYNFDHGSRSKSSKGVKKTIAKVNGIENNQLENTQRDNWLVIDVKVASEAYADKTRMRKKEEMAKKRRELREILGSRRHKPSRRSNTFSGRTIYYIEAIKR